ncbi:hypothetical protein EPUS_01621 [Endocarpon pusillum Z07020]|uniref:C3H1-type domain-containing protein n=1 Tax=Endocarpon pusillum (strain Z07020 / HMAS-L-300199) TaxID=1263415 RepID=U1GUS1_ENDPU|nr:uncharacterized protein EPUS_01621 [Endocarpon pusillum Z07020]ERF75791.1 hypothetical protein EPUS_01621 [Endocarpon pusillum Z07020]
MEDLDPRQQLETFKQNDAYKQLLTFTESLVTRVVDLSSQLEVVTGDLEDQNAIRRDWKRRAEAAEGAISQNPFISVLIDGDGYLFRDSYLKDVESGGGDAAHRLLSEIKATIKAAQLQSLSPDSQVVVNVYANKQGLTGALLEAGVISRPNDLEEFFCKFTQSQTHFQFIDCGPGKERVDAKLREAYRFFLRNCQCKLIFLALCHDNGYMAELDKYRNDVIAKQKTQLIDHYAKGRAFANPPFPMVNFEEVFSNRALPVKRVNGFAPVPTKSSYSSALAAPPTVEAASGFGQGHFNPPPLQSKPPPDAQSSPTTPFASRTNSFKELQTPYLASGVELPTSGDQVPVNRLDQRIDRPLQSPSLNQQRHFEDRITYHKLCNEHYLRDYCPDRNCRFDHSPIDKELKNTLRYTARKIVCRAGTACRRAGCYYGHQCPFPNCDTRRCPFAKAGLHEVRDLEIVRFVSPGG